MPTTDCLPHLDVEVAPRRAARLTFDAPATSSDGGWLLLAALDDARGTTTGLAAALRDRRAAGHVDHTYAALVRQRVLQLAAGYEDANDATTLRHDPLLRTLCRGAPDAPPLASQPTLSRLEARASLRDAVRAQRAHEARWVAGLPADLDALVLDVDGTDDPTHGQQPLAFYNAFYATTMYAPLLVFDPFGSLASARLRGGKHHAHQFAGPLLARLIAAVRARFPRLPIVVRADAGFAHAALVNRLLALRATHGPVALRLGVTPNATLQRGAAVEAVPRARQYAADTGRVGRYYDWLIYEASSWAAPLPVVVRAEAHPDGRVDLRAVLITEPIPEARVAYEAAYAPRGDAAENRIKDFKRGVAGDRLSCTRFAANALRLQLHAAAYELLHALRARVVAAAPAAPRPQLATLRRVLIKVAAVVRATARRVWIALPRAFPAAARFRALAADLAVPRRA